MRITLLVFLFLGEGWHCAQRSASASPGVGGVGSMVGARVAVRPRARSGRSADALVVCCASLGWLGQSCQDGKTGILLKKRTYRNPAGQGTQRELISKISWRSQPDALMILSYSPCGPIQTHMKSPLSSTANAL